VGADVHDADEARRSADDSLEAFVVGDEDHAATCVGR
jgi:hypothetical protein